MPNDDVDDHARCSGWYLRGENADVGSDCAQGLESGPSYPNPGTVWNGAVEAHSNALISPVKPTVRIAALYRIDDHGSLYRPCSYRRLLVEENK